MSCEENSLTDVGDDYFAECDEHLDLVHRHLLVMEAEDTCVVYGMPSAVVQAGLSDKSVPINRLAEAMREVR